MSNLEEKVAVITGGSSGIGLAISQRFVNEGAYVFIVGRRSAELEKAKSLIGENVTAVSADASNLDDLDRGFEIVRKEKGVVDILVTSAAMVEHATIAEITPEHFDKTFNLNVRGTFFTVQKALPLMTEGGSIILVSSAMHYLGNPRYTAYAATKAAVRSMSRTMAAELIERGIRVNTLSPGVTDTPMLRGAGSSGNEEMVQAYINITPMKRLASAEEIANGAYFLASNQSSFSTGTDLVIDGGIVEL